MSRTKGARDKKPRLLNETSLANLPIKEPGCVSASVRIYAPAGDVRWIEAMAPRERGKVVSDARRLHEA